MRSQASDAVPDCARSSVLLAMVRILYLLPVVIGVIFPVEFRLLEEIGTPKQRDCESVHLLHTPQKESRMVKQWTKRLPSGRSVTYSYLETEFEISATALIKRTRQVYSRVLSNSMTRDEVEREFQLDIRNRIC
jgi:hypothetical protein